MNILKLFCVIGWFVVGLSNALFPAVTQQANTGNLKRCDLVGTVGKLFEESKKLESVELWRLASLVTFVTIGAGSMTRACIDDNPASLVIAGCCWCVVGFVCTRKEYDQISGRFKYSTKV